MVTTERRWQSWEMWAFIGSILISIVSLVLFAVFGFPFLLLGLFLPFPIFFKRKTQIIGEEEPLFPNSPKYCPQCGTPRLGNYCFNCGYRFE